MQKKWTVLASILGLALGIGVAGCDPGSDSVEESRRAGTTSGAEEAKPDDDEGTTPNVGEEGMMDDDTFGEEGIVDDDTFGEEGIIDDDL